MRTYTCVIEDRCCTSCESATGCVGQWPIYIHRWSISDTWRWYDRDGVDLTQTGFVHFICHRLIRDTYDGPLRPSSMKISPPWNILSTNSVFKMSQFSYAISLRLLHRIHTCVYIRINRTYNTNDAYNTRCSL